MSASGQKRRFGSRPVTSGLSLSTDILVCRRHVSKVPEADVLTTDEAQHFVDRPSLLLIDNLVRRHRKCLRHDQPQRPRGLKVDDEIYIV